MHQKLGEFPSIESDAQKPPFEEPRDDDYALRENLLSENEEEARRAFSLLVQKHERHAKAIISKKYDVSFQYLEDLFAEGLKKIWKNRKTSKPEYSFLQYLIIVVSRLCLDFFKKEKSHRKHDELIQGENDFSFEPSQLEIVLRKERLEVQKKLLGRLKKHHPKLYDVVTLRLEGKNYDEISQILNIPQNTAKSRMKYAVRDYLSKWYKQKLP